MVSGGPASSLPSRCPGAAELPRCSGSGQHQGALPFLLWAGGFLSMWLFPPQRRLHVLWASAGHRLLADHGRAQVLRPQLLSPPPQQVCRAWHGPMLLSSLECSGTIPELYWALSHAIITTPWAQLKCPVNAPAPLLPRVGVRSSEGWVLFVPRLFLEVCYFTITNICHLWKNRPRKWLRAARWKEAEGRTEGPGLLTSPMPCVRGEVGRLSGLSHQPHWVPVWALPLSIKNKGLWGELNNSSTVQIFKKIVTFTVSRD